MQFVVAALNYLLGIPIFGWGTEVGFVYKGLLFLVALLIFTAYILLADRKIWAAVQVRRGPNVVGPFGLLQSFVGCKIGRSAGIVPLRTRPTYVPSCRYVSVKLVP